eukprot:6195725-Pleurochrysis_carterae.AAC.8
MCMRTVSEGGGVAERRGAACLRLRCARCSAGCTRVTRRGGKISAQPFPKQSAAMSKDYASQRGGNRDYRNDVKRG